MTFSRRGLLKVVGATATVSLVPSLAFGGTLSLRNLRTGANVDLDPATHGKPLWLGFWASWCGFCRHELPILQEMHHRWGPQGIDLMTISVDESPGPAARHLKTRDLTLPALIDTTGRVQAQFGDRRLPFNIVFDAKGNEVRRWAGMDESAFADESWLQQLV
jgi:thiol-disulfide isomerase/thioredoxin